MRRPNIHEKHTVVAESSHACDHRSKYTREQGLADQRLKQQITNAQHTEIPIPTDSFKYQNLLQANHTTTIHPPTKA